MAAFSIWFAQSLLCCSFLLASSDSPLGGTRGQGNHHFSSCRTDGRPQDEEEEDEEQELAVRGKNKRGFWSEI